jgi:hypothetical protein
MAQIRGDCIDEAYRKSKNAWLDIVYRLHWIAVAARLQASDGLVT